MKLILFDVDGTLINAEPNVWSILNSEFDFQEHDNLLCKKYVDKEITYQEWVDKDFDHYICKGLDKNRLKNIFERYKPFPGVIETLELVGKEKSINVLSGGIDFLLKVHNLDRFFENLLINKILFEGNEIIKVETTQYDIEKKVDGLLYLSQLKNIGLEDTCYIGDGDNDFCLAKFMKNNGGIFIAFNSKSQELKDNAKYVVNSKDMRDVLIYIN